MTEDVKVIKPQPRYCRIRPNLETIMACHKIAQELHGNTQDTDTILDKWNNADRRAMMLVVEQILLETVNPDWIFETEAWKEYIKLNKQ